jgi:hypothetical protein
MPRFYFHLENTATPVRDTQGAELDGLEAAKCHAVTIIAEALCEHPKGFWEAETYQITVTDEDNLTLFMVCMMSVIAPVIRPRDS